MTVDLALLVLTLCATLAGCAVPLAVGGSEAGAPSLAFEMRHTVADRRNYRSASFLSWSGHRVSTNMIVYEFDPLAPPGSPPMENPTDGILSSGLIRVGQEWALKFGPGALEFGTVLGLLYGYQRFEYSEGPTPQREEADGILFLSFPSVFFSAELPRHLRMRAEWNLGWSRPDYATEAAVLLEYRSGPRVGIYAGWRQLTISRWSNGTQRCLVSGVTLGFEWAF